jgi:hypothetical protein
MLRFGVIPLMVSMGVLASGVHGRPEQEPDRLKDKVQPYIQAGVEFLQRKQTGSGTWEYLGNSSPHQAQVIGCSALCGIALMENMVPPADKSVQEVYKVVKAAANNPDFNYNYSVSLALMFLHRYNRDRIVMVNDVVSHPDSGLIQKLADKLVRGQAQDGRWGYSLNKAAGDNSNTQFAVVALWLARKYSKSKVIENALMSCAKRLRTSQEPGGGWNYEPSNVQVAMKPTGSMTCAGLLSIALDAGARQENNAIFAQQGQIGLLKKLNEDPAIVKARIFLVNSLQANTRAQGGGMDSHMTYFLWSLERVATLYRWKKINDVDWLEIGARYLMARQSRDGSWRMDFLSGEYVDTAFALLFLGQSNLLGPLWEADFVGGPIGPGPLNPGNLPNVAPKKTDPAAEANDALRNLLDANADKQAEYLKELQEGKGGEYTDVLVMAIKKLKTTVGQTMAREALALRLANKTTKNLLEYLDEPERELRLAALTALKFKGEVSVCKKVIEFVASPDKDIAAAALGTLKSLSNQDFGHSIDKWTRWWEQTQKSKPE